MCDFCNKEFYKNRCRKSHLSGNSYCSPVCRVGAMKKGGVANKKFESTCMKRYGVENPCEIPYVKKTLRLAWKRQEKSILKKMKKTSLEKYGVESHKKRPEERERQGKISRERFQILRESGKLPKNRGVSRRLRGCYLYTRWQKLCYERDGRECTACGATDDLCVDHIKPFSQIIIENKIETLEEGLQTEELWDPNNGRVLCQTCHRKTETFGNKAYANFTKATK